MGVIDAIKKRLENQQNTQLIQLSKEELIQLYYDLGSWSEISRQLDISLSTIQRLRRKYKLHVLVGQNKLISL